jgi:hypothetical protein
MSLAMIAIGSFDGIRSNEGSKTKHEGFTKGNISDATINSPFKIGTYD